MIFVDINDTLRLVSVHSTRMMSTTIPRTSDLAPMLARRTKASHRDKRGATKTRNTEEGVAGERERV
jgi:hypothetical protein